MLSVNVNLLNPSLTNFAPQWQYFRQTFMSSKTTIQFDAVIARCKDIFIKKNHDYGASWRILRVSSLIDQLYIKAKRIRTIEDKQSQKIADDVASEFVGLINYCIMALIQIKKKPIQLQSETEETFDALIELYDLQVKNAKELMLNKNHDYGEVWREMYLSSFTDLILTKLLRIRQIIENEGKTLISEGIDANLFDIINYAVFALIKIDEQNESI